MAASPPAQRAIVKLAQDILNEKDAGSDRLALDAIDELIKRWTTTTKVRLRKSLTREERRQRAVRKP